MIIPTLNSDFFNRWKIMCKQDAEVFFGVQQILCSTIWVKSILTMFYFSGASYLGRTCTEGLIVTIGWGISWYRLEIAKEGFFNLRERSSNREYCESWLTFITIGLRDLKTTFWFEVGFRIDKCWVFKAD